MSYLTIHPDFQSLFAEAGLATTEAVLRLRSIVLAVTLGAMSLVPH